MTQNSIVIYKKYFEIDGASQKPKDQDVGSYVVVGKGHDYDGWKLESDRWRWHCGVDNDDTKWTGPIGKLIDKAAPNYGDFLKNIANGIFGSWEAARLDGCKKINIHYDGGNGKITWTCDRSS